uniref:phage holin family protein n=1 Tax=Demequina sp. TaxID=2050685 RepID=UPI0025FB9EB4
MTDPQAPVAAPGVTRPRRPVAVIALALVTGLGGLLEIAVAAAVLVTPVQGDDAGVPTAVTLALGIAGLALLTLAVTLWRGSNGARLLLTALLAFRVLYALYQAGESGIGAAATVVAVAGASLALAWSPSAHAWFQGDRERELSHAIHASPRTVRGRATRAAQLAVQALLVWATIGITPGVTADGWIAGLAAGVAVGVVTWLLQPVWLRLASRFGWAGTLVTALGANVVTVGLALWLAPGVDVANVGWALVASWVLTILMTLVTWLFSVGSYDYLLVHATRSALRGDRPEPDGLPGMLIIQLDGVSAPLLENEIRAGNLPTVSRWIRSGSHRWTEWTARVPSTTPVSQAGILHGSNENIPAFRWWDRELGRMLVANVPADAALIEERISDGRGLLADGGVSISNLFSGDAPRSFLTMSGMRGGDRS